MTALVTGASRGIGAAVALKLAEAGFPVAVVYQHSGEKAAQVVEKCRQYGVAAAAFAADVASEADCQRLVEDVSRELGQVFVLVNNAGINRDGLCLRMSQEQFNQVLATNLTGSFLMSRQVLPAMLKAHQGRIINMSSVAGLHGNAGQVNYSAAKAGLVGMTKALAKEVGSRQITVNAVAPGFIETDMTSALPEKIRQQARTAISLGRFGQAEEVAGLVAFLASPAAGYITGQVIEISGGLVL
jgi:3-oxoacyl-[acyl-carrier protein] reductase